MKKRVLLIVAFLLAITVNVGAWTVKQGEQNLAQDPNMFSGCAQDQTQQQQDNYQPQPQVIQQQQVIQQRQTIINNNNNYYQAPRR